MRNTASLVYLKCENTDRVSRKELCFSYQQRALHIRESVISVL